jgi:hypothetical protein
MYSMSVKCKHAFSVAAIVEKERQEHDFHISICSRTKLRNSIYLTGCLRTVYLKVGQKC